MKVDFISLMRGTVIGLWLTCTIVVFKEWCERVSMKSLLKEMDRLKEEREATLPALPADWHQDSSLETWFPLTAEELGRRKHNERVLRYAVEQLLSERDGDTGNIDDTLLEAEMEIQAQEKREAK